MNTPVPALPPLDLAPGVQGPPLDIVQNTNGAPFWLYWDVQRAVQGLPITVTSWWRTRAHNAAVGGEPTSQHLIGTAMDLGGAPQYYVQIGKRLWWAKPINEGDHLHVQLYAAGEASWWISRFAR